MTAPSLDTVSEVFPPSVLFQVPMMTRLLSCCQPLEWLLFSESLTGRVTQLPHCQIHSKQLLSVDESFPPQSMLPAWTCFHLSSGSEGSWHVVLLPGRNTSADCTAPIPPVIRMAAEMEIFIFSGNHTHKITKFLEASNPVISCLI